jgi:hypothetical protein
MARVPKATMSFCHTDEEKVPTSQAESMAIWRENLALGTFSSTLKVSPIGGDFRDHIRTALIKSQALIVVIGQRWVAYFRQSAGWLS